MYQGLVFDFTHLVDSLMLIRMSRQKAKQKGLALAQSALTVGASCRAWPSTADVVLRGEVPHVMNSEKVMCQGQDSEIWRAIGA